MASASSSIAARTMSATLRLWPRCTTSAPRACSSRRIMLMAASWPSNSEAADTNRSGGRAVACSLRGRAAPPLRPAFMGSYLPVYPRVKCLTDQYDRGTATGQRSAPGHCHPPCQSRCRRRSRYNTLHPMNSRRANPPSAGKPAASSASPWRARRERVRDRELKREAVIRAAAREFNRKGYHNTSLDDIAARLEVTKPTVYYYVTSKEQLLFECFVAGVEQIRKAFRDVRHLAVPARERLSAVLRHYGEAVASEFGWCMVRAEDQDLSPAMSRHIKQ